MSDYQQLCNQRELFRKAVARDILRLDALVSIQQAPPTDEALAESFDQFTHHWSSWMATREQVEAHKAERRQAARETMLSGA